MFRHIWFVISRNPFFWRYCLVLVSSGGFVVIGVISLVVVVFFFFFLSLLDFTFVFHFHFQNFQRDTIYSFFFFFFTRSSFPAA